ncbi:syndecan-4 isoform X2 [Vanacampus margaritifer]
MSPLGTPANLLAFSLLLIFSTWCSRVASESVRETETWMPLGAAPTPRHERQESSGDFGFTDGDEEDEDERDDEDDDYYESDDWYDDDEDYGDETSGSGDTAELDRSSPGRDWPPPTKHPEADNRIPEWAGPSVPAVGRGQEPDAAPEDNEIPPVRDGPRSTDRLPSNVLMSHAADTDGVLARTDVLAALICGGGVCLTLAVVLVVMLLHRMKKKDEGSYELVKKPIYTKTATAEIYA